MSSKLCQVNNKIILLVAVANHEMDLIDITFDYIELHIEEKREIFFLELMSKKNVAQSPGTFYRDFNNFAG